MIESKLDSLVHYVCARCNDPSLLGATKLNKILWYSDVLAYVSTGNSISGAIYVKRQFGPVPKDILASKARLVASKAIIERNITYHGYNQKQLIALRNADVTVFTAEEVSIVNEVIETVCTKHTAASVSHASHDSVWHAAEIGEEIPLFAIFSGNVGELDEGDMAWAQAEIKKIEAEHEVA
jgi:hypothetical protein